MGIRTSTSEPSTMEPMAQKFVLKSLSALDRNITVHTMHLELIQLQTIYGSDCIEVLCGHLPKIHFNGPGILTWQ